MPTPSPNKRTPSCKRSSSHSACFRLGGLLPWNAATLIVLAWGGCGFQTKEGDDTSISQAEELDPPSPLDSSNSLEDILKSLNKHRGCAGILLEAFNHEETLNFSLQVDGLLAEAYEAGGKLEIAYDLSSKDSDTVVTLTEGHNLGYLHCTDLFEPDMRTGVTWHATSGTARVHVYNVTKEDEPVDYLGRAYAQLQNVVLESENGERITVDFTFRGSDVGWYIGAGREKHLEMTEARSSLDTGPNHPPPFALWPSAGPASDLH